MKKRKIRNFWNKKTCKEEALKFKSRSLFKKKSPGAFGKAYTNGWLDEICLHMSTVGNKFLRLVYVYYFEDNSVYIGLTHDLEERDDKHRRDKRSKVYQHIVSTGLNPIITYSDYIKVDDAIRLEKETLEKYKQEKYNILNVAKTGAVGGCNLKWTFEKCREEALKYKTRKEFADKNNSAYNSARRYE